MSQDIAEKNSALTLAIWSTVTTFIIPIAGVILGHLSLSKYKTQTVQKGWRLAVFFTCFAWSIIIMQTSLILGWTFNFIINYI